MMALVATVALDIETHCPEGREFHADAPFFHRRDQVMMAVLFAAQDAGEQAHQGLTVDDAAFVIPGAIAGNAQIQHAGQGWIPAFHGGRVCQVRRNVHRYAKIGGCVIHAARSSRRVAMKVTGRHNRKYRRDAR